MSMLSTLLLVLAATMLGSATWGSPVTVYRCSGSEGVGYADTPCGVNAQKQDIFDKRLGGTLDEGLSPAVPPARNQAEPGTSVEIPRKSSACRNFQSTDLRSYLIREQVVPGMTRAQVRRAWGAPAETYTEPVEMWVYDTTYYGRLLTVTRVYFSQGCVTNVDTTDP